MKSSDAYAVLALRNKGVQSALIEDLFRSPLCRVLTVKEKGLIHRLCTENQIDIPDSFHDLRSQK